MDDLIEGLTRGNVAEVKVVLASVALALAVYQLALIAVGYGKPPSVPRRPPRLLGAPRVGRRDRGRPRRRRGDVPLVPRA